MLKLIFFLLLALLTVVEPAPVAAEASADMALEAVAPGPTKMHRPNYKRYRGNSSKKKKRPGMFRRWAARRKAKRKQKAAPARRGVIRVDAPDVKMPAPPKP